MSLFNVLFQETLLDNPAYLWWVAHETKQILSTWIGRRRFNNIQGLKWEGNTFMVSARLENTGGQLFKRSLGIV